jgi:hypothetical protein
MKQRVKDVKAAKAKSRGRTKNERDLIEAIDKGCFHAEYNAFLDAPFGDVVSTSVTVYRVSAPLSLQTLLIGFTFIV